MTLHRAEDRQVHALSDERLLLGLALRDTDAAIDLVALCPADDLASPHHRALLALIADRIAKNQPIDEVSVVMACHDLGADKFGGAPYVATLSDIPSTGLDRAALCQRIRGRAALRTISELSGVLAKIGRDEPASFDGDALSDDPSTAASTVARALLDLGLQTGTADSSVGEAAESAFADREWARLSGKPRAIPTGHHRLDELMDGGFRPGELIVVAGRPGAGKTAFGLGVAEDLAAERWKVGFVSLEMSREELADRVLARAARVAFSRLRRGELDDSDDVAAWRDSLLEFPFRIWPPSSATPAGIVAQARRWKASGLDLLVIDYLQLVRHDKADRHDLAVGGTATRLKQLARDLGIPVMVLCQLNREVEKRSAPRKQAGQWGAWWEDVALPQLSDLRDSGQIEQDADVVLYPMRAEPMGIELPGAAAVYVAKNRNGRTGVVPATWEGATASYRELR